MERRPLVTTAQKPLPTTVFHRLTFQQEFLDSIHDTPMPLFQINVSLTGTTWTLDRAHCGHLVLFGRRMTALEFLQPCPIYGPFRILILFILQRTERR